MPTLIKHVRNEVTKRCFTSAYAYLLLSIGLAIISLNSVRSESLDETALVGERKREAYVALFYGKNEGFLLGLRVLGQSLKESGSKKEMVALCLPDVSNDVKFLLAKEGWVIYPISTKSINYDGPFAGHVFKLAVLTLTQYTKIVLVDTDVIAYENADDIFNCGSYCAAMRHSNMFNSGVMLLTPNLTHFMNILKMLNHWDPLAHSHKGGDQDILNVYFSQIQSAVTYNKSDPNYVPPTFAQLPYEYNMDAGMYYLRSEWLIKRKDFRFLHYTLGNIRPWQWLTYPFCDLNQEWQEIRFRLKEPTKEMFTSIFRYLPFYLIMFVSMVRITTFQAFHRQLALAVWGEHANTKAYPKKLKVVLTKLFPPFYRFYKVIIFSALAFSAVFSVLLVPMHVRPFTGWTMFICVFLIMVAHIFEITFLICHYGSRNTDRFHRTFRFYSVHSKIILFIAVYIIASVLLVTKLHPFVIKWKVSIVLLLSFITILSYTIDHLIQLYTQYLPCSNPMSPPRFFAKDDNTLMA